MHSFTLVCILRLGGHIWSNRKIIPPAATTSVVWLFALGIIDLCQARAEKPLITYMHLSYLNALLYTRMHTASWRPYLIKSENCSTCINYRCCMIVCTRLRWFKSSQSWETFDHTGTCLIIDGPTTDDGHCTIAIANRFAKKGTFDKHRGHQEGGLQPPYPTPLDLLLVSEHYL